MKRILTTVAILVCAASAFGQYEHTQTSVARVTGGSLDATNLTETAYRPLQFDWKIPSSGVTNTFSYSIIRKVYRPETKTTSIVTNDFFDSGTANYIETNTVIYPAGWDTMTNTWTIASTTNDTALQSRDIDDFPKYIMVEPNDVERFAFTSETNAITLFRVYEKHSRP